MIRLDRVRLAMIAAITASTGAVGLWARSKYPRRALGDEIVTARVASGPTFRGLSQYQADEPTTVRWTVSSVTTGDRTGLFIGGRRWYHDVTAGQTVTNVRDALQAQLTASGIEPDLTVTPVSTNALNLTGAVGLIYTPSAIGPAAVAVQASTPCEVVTGTGLLELELQAFATGHGAEAVDLITRVITGLDDHLVLDTWDRLGVVHGNAGVPLDISSIAGADWESRAACRLGISTRAYQATAVETIETADLNLSTDAPGASILVSV